MTKPSLLEAIANEIITATATIRTITDHPEPGHGLAMVGVVQGLVERASTRAAELDRIGAGATTAPAVSELASACGPFVQAVVRAKAVLRGQVQTDDLFADWYGKSVALFESIQRLQIRGRPPGVQVAPRPKTAAPPKSGSAKRV